MSKYHRKPNGHQNSIATMPRRLRTPKARSPVTDGMLAQLRCGHDYFRDGFGGIKTGRDLDYEHAERVWREYKDVVFEATRKDGPGLRPWAWWQFDAPERRSEEPEVVQLARLGLLGGDEVRAFLESFERERATAEEPYTNASWPVATGQALEIVNALSPTEIGALREHEQLHETGDDAA